jgi:hypothetical protein
MVNYISVFTFFVIIDSLLTRLWIKKDLSASSLKEITFYFMSFTTLRKSPNEITLHFRNIENMKLKFIQVDNNRKLNATYIIKTNDANIYFFQHTTVSGRSLRVSQASIAQHPTHFGVPGCQSEVLQSNPHAAHFQTNCHKSGMRHPPPFTTILSATFRLFDIHSFPFHTSLHTIHPSHFRHSFRLLPCIFAL